MAVYAFQVFWILALCVNTFLKFARGQIIVELICVVVDCLTVCLVPGRFPWFVLLSCGILSFTGMASLSHTGSCPEGHSGE